MPKPKGIGRLNGPYDPGILPQVQVHRGGDPTASPDDFTGTPVHTLAYLIASSRVTVSTAPPSGSAPPTVHPGLS